MSSVLILEKKGGPWEPFLRDYFSDTPAVMVSTGEASQATLFFDRSMPGVLFAEPAFYTRSFLQKIKVRKNTDPSFRAFLLGDDPLIRKEVPFDAVFQGETRGDDFNRRFVETLPMPDLLRLLVVDDEEEVGRMVRDYFEGRKSPAFKIECSRNGKVALEAIAKERPDVIVLDIKMPVMDGREFYTQLQAKKMDIPVIVFFDSVSGEELSEIRKSGDPAVIEKGYQGSSLSSLMALVKKLAFFSGAR